MIYKKRDWDKNKKAGVPHAVFDNFLDEDKKEDKTKK